MFYSEPLIMSVDDLKSHDLEVWFFGEIINWSCDVTWSFFVLRSSKKLHPNQLDLIKSTFSLNCFFSCCWCSNQNYFCRFWRKTSTEQRNSFVINIKMEKAFFYYIDIYWKCALSSFWLKMEVNSGNKPKVLFQRPSLNQALMILQSTQDSGGPAELPHVGGSPLTYLSVRWKPRGIFPLRWHGGSRATQIRQASMARAAARRR